MQRSGPSSTQLERKRKDRDTGPHLVFHATPFVLQRFCNKKKKRNQPISPTILATWFHDLLSAMLHCHSNDVILRNFQGDQIVVDHSGVAKLAGFYRASVLSEEDKNTDIFELAKQRKLKPNHVDILTNPYAAPEMLLGSPKVTKETDIWTLGYLFAQLLLCRPIASVGALQHEFMQEYTEQCTSEKFRDDFVNDWMSQKNILMRSNKNESDEIKERQRGTKRKAMLMAATWTISCRVVQQAKYLSYDRL
jgi:serine/threonine protein kinase